nr:hypothetical protein 16 [Pseudomonadaceae bacterium]
MTKSKAPTKAQPTTRQPGWLNKKEMAASLGISPQAFDSWGVEPVTKIGRENLYTVKDVVDNRVRKTQEKHHKEMGGYNNPDDQGDGLPMILDPVERLKAERLKEEIVQLRLRNSVLEGRSLPSWAVTEVISRILSVAVGVFDTLPLEIKRRHPALDVRVIRMFEERIAKVRNEAATVPEQLQEILDDVIAEAEDRIR